jgi:hypothetical protein
MSIALSAGQPFGEMGPSGRAAVIVRGVQRMLSDLGLVSLTEVTLSNGRRADMMAVSAQGEILVLEVKSCLQDFASDQKWPDYAPYCDRFYFAVDCEFPRDRIPPDVGLVVADAFGGAILRPALVCKLAAPRRRMLTLGFARLAAARLLRVSGGAAGAREDPLGDSNA